MRKKWYIFYIDIYVLYWMKSSNLERLYCTEWNRPVWRDYIVLNEIVQFGEIILIVLNTMKCTFRHEWHLQIVLNTMKCTNIIQLLNFFSNVLSPNIDIRFQTVSLKLYNVIYNNYLNLICLCNSLWFEWTQTRRIDI
jgi:hypothetical protein